ncbi:caskin-1 [Biomphalaria pfeifferi]|uniref:Caskin-1 n=1 Tax=Biomphalaria pfeifferi TaxID=112525 RepID=A0AAD8BL71_BIOPF|nr:caskin-1 [Biomphalaria pfeifferi]
MSFRITSPLCQQKSSYTYGKIYPRAALCGVDVNKPDSYDQTALDIVTKFTSGHAGKELKHILKEASCAVYARATKDYSNVYDPGSLAFKEGDIITVLEQKADGIWRGYVFHEGRMAKTGMFPANHVVLVDSKGK